MNTELKNCPFCDSEPIQMNDYDYWYVCCKAVRCTTWPKTDIFFEQEDAVKAWNKRKKDGQ